MEQGRSRSRGALVENLLPTGDQKVPFLPKFFRALAEAGGAGDEAAFPGPQILQQGPQALALGFIGDPPGDAHLGQGRSVDQKMARQGDVGGETGSLGPQGPTEHLDQDFLAFVETVADGGRRQFGTADFPGFILEPEAVKFVLPGADVLGKEIGRPLQADVDEGRSHARQQPEHPSLVNIAGGTVTRPALQIELRQTAILHQGHPDIASRHADE